VITGYSTSFGEGDDNFYVVKTDEQGDTLWTRTYGGSGNEDAYSIQQTTDGGYVIAGCTDSYGEGDNDFYVVKTDAQGDTLWTRTYGGIYSDVAYCIRQTTDGGYAVAGSAYSSGDTGSDAYVVKTDAQGDTLWTRTYGGSDYDRATCIQQTTDGGYAVAGSTFSFGAGGSDSYVVKTDAQGDTLWTRTYGGIDYDRAYCIQQTTDGGYVLAGSTVSSGAGDHDYYVVKTGPDAPNAAPERIATLPAGFVLEQNYPNPFNASTTISFDLPRAGHVLLIIFDLTGRSVATLTDETMSAGSHHLNFNAAALPSGIYVYRLTTNGVSQSRKLALLK